MSTISLHSTHPRSLVILNAKKVLEGFSVAVKYEVISIWHNYVIYFKQKGALNSLLAEVTPLF